MKIVSIWSPKGGVGKTTLTAHLADCLSIENNQKVLAYDGYPQLALYHSSKQGGFTFDVTDRYPESQPECDFFLVDFRPTIKLTNKEKSILVNSHHVIVPVRASRLDLDSVKAVKDIVDPQKIINVLSCYDKRFGDQKAVRTELAKDFELISYLSIYARALNDFKTIYTRKNSNLHGIEKAKLEVGKIAQRLI
jgi:cellulose biosynthesis protein BcsQ